MGSLHDMAFNSLMVPRLVLRLELLPVLEGGGGYIPADVLLGRKGDTSTQATKCSL